MKIEIRPHNGQCGYGAWLVAVVPGFDRFGAVLHGEADDNLPPDVRDVCVAAVLEGNERGCVTVGGQGWTYRIMEEAE